MYKIVPETLYVAGERECRRDLHRRFESPAHKYIPQHIGDERYKEQQVCYVRKNHFVSLTKHVVQIGCQQESNSCNDNRKNRNDGNKNPFLKQ